MRNGLAGATYALTLLGLAALPTVGAAQSAPAKCGWKDVACHARRAREAAAEKARQAAADKLTDARDAVEGGAAADGGSTAGGSAGGEVAGMLSAPRNRNPSITGVWTGTVIAPRVEPNRFDFRLEITDRDGTLSGQTRISVPGKPLQYAVHSIDGTLEDGVIQLKEVNKLKEGSSVPSCASYSKPITLIVRRDGTMAGEIDPSYGCSYNARLSLQQISTTSPELADAAAGADSPPSGGGAPAPAPTAGPAATMVTNPNVTGTWTGTATHPRGNPNRFKYRLELAQRAGVVTGTARTEVPDNPLQFWVYSMEGNVEEGIITLNTKQLLRHGSEGGSCNTRSVLMLKTDGTLTGEWKGCGEGQVYVTKTR